MSDPEHDAAPGGTHRGRTGDTTSIEADNLTTNPTTGIAALTDHERAELLTAVHVFRRHGMKADGINNGVIAVGDPNLGRAITDERNRREARRRVDAEQAATVDVPPFDALDRLLDEPDEDVVYRIDRLWPAEGRVLFYAQKKTGKSTAVANIVRAVVDGTPVFGMFDVAPFDGRVTVIDTELSRNFLRRWYRAQGIARTDRIDLYALRGKVASFNILDPTIRSRWAAMLRARRTRIVILDCLRPALDALGLSEDKDFGRFAVAFDALLDEACVDEAIIVHHAGHQGDRMRGDSRIGDWPDAIWHIGLDKPGDPYSVRSFDAHGRDVLEPARAMAYDADTRHLTIAGGSTVRERALDAACDAVRAALDESDTALTRRQLEPAAHEIAKRGDVAVTRARIRDAIDHLDINGELTRTDGPRRLQLYELPIEPANTAPDHPSTTTDGGSE